MEEDKKQQRISEIALWISIAVFVLATLLIIYVFDNQDNQDRKKIDTPEAQKIVTMT